MAGGEALRVDETDWRSAQGETARLGQGGVAVCVYVCRLQPAANSKAESAVCVRGARRLSRRQCGAGGGVRPPNLARNQGARDYMMLDPASSRRFFQEAPRESGTPPPNPC